MAVAAGVIPKLVALLGSEPRDDEVAVEVAVWGLQHIAHQNFTGQNALREAGALPALVKASSSYDQIIF